MNPNIFKKFSVAAALLGSSSIALASGSFQEASEHLDLDGDFIGFMDFDGDGQVIGEKLNVVYQDFAQVIPDMPPFPLDFPAIFETLGFASIRSMGVSSTEVEDGLFRNRSVTLLDGDPAGLLKVYGLEPISFRAAELAPADATTVFSGQLNFNEIVATAKALANQIMGPMGEGMVMQGLMQPVPGTDVTIQEAVEAFSGGLDMIMSQSYENPQQPDIKIWTSFKGAGSLLTRLEPLLAQMGVLFVDTEEGRSADLSMLVEDAPFGLFVEVPAGTSDLLVYTDMDWVRTFGADDAGLVGTAKYQSVAGRLPEDAAFYAYSSGFDIHQFSEILSQNPDTALLAPVIVKSIDSLFGGFLAPNASATFREGNALISEGYAGFSYKSLVVALPAGIGAGIGIGVATNKSKTRGSQSPRQENKKDDALPDSE